MLLRFVGMASDGEKNDEKNNKFCFEKSKICSKRKNKEVGNDASLIEDVTPQSKDW